MNSPEDFKDSLFRLINQNHVVPEACCQRASQSGDLVYTSQEQCLLGNMMFRNNKVKSDVYYVILFPPPFLLPYTPPPGLIKVEYSCECETSSDWRTSPWLISLFLCVLGVMEYHITMCIYVCIYA